MNRTVNLKAVAILAAIATTSGVAVHFAHGYQVKRFGRDVIEQAAQAERDGQPADAAKCLEQYLGFVPDDIDTQARYALALKQSAKTRGQELRAFFVLEKVLRKDNDRNDIRRAAAEVGLRFGRFSETKGYLETLQRFSPNDAELALMRGKCELGLGNLDKATEHLVNAANFAPQRVPLAVEVVGWLRSKRLEQRSSADMVMENLARRGQPPAEAHEAVARYFMQTANDGVSDKTEQQSRLDKADQFIQTAMTDSSKPSADLLLLAAELAQVRGQFAQTRQHLERGISLYPKDSRMARFLAQVDLKDGRREEAKGLMATAAQTTPEMPDEIFTTAETMIELGQFEEAKVLIAKLRAGKSIAPALMLSGRLAMKNAAWGDARIELEKARSAGVAPVLAKYLYVWLAECYGRLGFADQELIACRRASEIDRSWIPARRGLAAALGATGQLDQAVEEYRALLNQGTDVRTELARALLIRTQRLPAKDRTYDEIDRLLQPSPNSDKPAPVMLQAEVLLAKGKSEDAQRLLEAERDRDPTQVGIWLALTTLAQRSGNPDADLGILVEAEKCVGPRVEWDLARARHWLRANSKFAAAELNKLEANIERLADADRLRLLAALAEIYKLRGDLESAQRLLLQITDRSRDNLAARYELFEMALQTNSNTDAEKHLSEIRRIEGPNGPLSAYGEAARHIARAARGDNAALAAAAAPLAKAAELSPTWSRVLTLQAQAFDIGRQPDKAVEKYLEAIEHGDGRLGVTRRTLQLLYQQRRYAEANTLVSKLSKQSLTETNLGRLVAQVLADSPVADGSDPKESRQRALDLARQTVKADSRYHRDYLWLGQMAVIADQPAEAEQSLRHALRLEPNSPEGWVMLVSLLAKSDPKKADAELESARQILAKDQLAAVLAPCLEVLGRTKEADEQYKAALAARPNDIAVVRSAAAFMLRTGQSGAAIPLLRKLIDPASRAPEDTVAWARRTLSLSMAASGNFQQYREALTLIDANGAGAPSDQLAKAIILAAQPANRRDAIKLFESLTSQKAALPADARFVMAQLYEADGNWNKARVHMLALVNEFDKNPTYIARYIRGLLRHDGADEASRWVEKLAELKPTAFETTELKARVLKAQGRSDAEAAEPIRVYARTKDARIEVAAALLEEFGAVNDAEMLFRQFVAASSASRPQAPLALAGFLARHQRLPEALSLCERAWATCPPENVAAACVAALRLGDGDAAQQQQVEQWINAAMTKVPQSSMLPTMLGMMYEAANRPSDAIARYRQVLQQDPRNVVALNNLAILLSHGKTDSAEALTLINQALELAGPDAELLDSRALIYLRAGQAAPALRDVQQAIVQVPMPSKTLNFRLAQVQLANKNRAAAIEAMAKAKKLGLQANDLVIAEREEFQKLAAELNMN